MIVLPAEALGLEADPEVLIGLGLGLPFIGRLPQPCLV